jgi:hypothetical protein
MAKVAFITSIYGDYEDSCKPFPPQSIPVDFICFTDNKDIYTCGWIIDTNPYHYTHPSPLDTGKEYNSVHVNKHTFNIAKYYKQSFHNIPRLAGYDVVIWIDATVEVLGKTTAEYMLHTVKKYGIVGWSHEERSGKLIDEMEMSMAMVKYNSTSWIDQSQPLQDVRNQYNEYIKQGYSDDIWKQFHNENPNYGVWITCFVGFHMRDSHIISFLDHWYKQTLDYTTQDQVSFTFSCFHKKLYPYTLPDKEIQGEYPHIKTDLYYKHDHGI